MNGHHEFGGVPGWKGFEFQLMIGPGGEPVLMSNDVIRLYMTYLAECRAKNADGASFGDWILDAAPPKATASADAG